MQKSLRQVSGTMYVCACVYRTNCSCVCQCWWLIFPNTHTHTHGFPDSSVGKESACNAGDPSSSPGLGRSAGEGKGYPLQYSWVSFVAQLVKNSACIAGDLGSIPGLGRSPGERKGYPLQYSGLENSRECTVLGVAQMNQYSLCVLY